LESPLGFVNLLLLNCYFHELPRQSLPTCLNVSRKSKKFLFRLSLRCGATSIPTCNQAKQDYLHNGRTNCKEYIWYDTIFVN
jgi:hypothetical protein